MIGGVRTVNKFFPTLAVAVTGAILGLATVTATAEAAAFKFEFLSALDGDNLGFGTLEFDSAPITGVGLEETRMNLLENPRVDLEIGGDFAVTVPGFPPVTGSAFFDESAIVPPSPFLTFLDGQLVGFSDTLQTTVNVVGIDLDIIAEATGDEFQVFATLPVPDAPQIPIENGTIIFQSLTEGNYLTESNYNDSTSVPDPSTFLGLGALAVFVALARPLGTLRTVGRLDRQ